MKYKVDDGLFTCSEIFEELDAAVDAAIECIDIEGEFNDMVDDRDGSIEVCGYYYDAHEVLEGMSPVDYDDEKEAFEEEVRAEIYEDLELTGIFENYGVSVEEVDDEEGE